MLNDRLQIVVVGIGLAAGVVVVVVGVLFGAVAPEHVLAEHGVQPTRLGGRRVGLGLLVHHDHVVPPGHQPHPEVGNPRDRLVGPQSGEGWVRGGLEGCEGDGRPDR